MSPIATRLERARLFVQSFQAKLLLTLLLPLLAIVGVVAWTSASMQARQQVFLGEQQLTTAKWLAGELNMKITERFAVLAAVAADLDVTHLDRADGATTVLRQRPALRPLFPAGSVIFNRAGIALGDYPVVPGRKGGNYADREFLQRLFATGKATISEPFVARPSQRLRLSMCAPIIGDGQRVVAALCGNFDQQSVDFLGRLSDSALMGNNGFFLIRTSDRMLIASTETHRIMSRLPDSALVRKLMNAGGNAFVATSAAGIEKLYASAPVAVAGWALAVGLPTDIAYAPVRATVTELKQAALAASLLVVLATFFLAKRMLQPLQQAGLMMDAMSSGRAPLQRVDETGDTEVRRLLTSFNRLSDSVASQQTQLQTERNALLQAKGALDRLNLELETKVAQRSQKLVELNTFLHDVLEVLPFGVAVFDGTRTAIFRNKLFGTLLGYPPELAGNVPLSIADMVRLNHEQGDYPDQGADEVLARFADLMDARAGACVEHLKTDGTCLEMRCQPIATDWTLLTYTDISAHKRAERSLRDARHVAESATVAKSNFIANLSHEIRTPMNAILGLAYILEKTALPGDALELVGKIRMAGQSLLGIINDILDFSKIESGKLEIEHSPFRLVDVLDNLATIMSASAGEKDVELIIAAPPSRTNLLYGDAMRLEQVLINLTSNAIKFTDHGHVCLAIDVLTEAAQRVTLRFAVRDSGIGIAPEIQTAIFSAFAQADGSTSRRFGGTGLGLSISQRLVTAMGGDIKLVSVPGSGSEFYFTLSFERSADAWVSAPEMAKLAILIADDNAIAREALCGIATGLGWTAVAVSSGPAAIAHAVARQAARAPCEVIVLDWKMPGMDGLAAARAMRTALAEPAGPIVIMVTAAARQDVLAHEDGHFADAVLNKPVTPSTLYNAVARALRVRQGGEEQAPIRHTQRLAGLRILVVDDSEINRMVAQRILGGEGAAVVPANDGSEAVDWLRRHPGDVDIVLMDVQMPLMNGYEATRQIRRTPTLAALPVVALSAGAFNEQRELAHEAGMNGFIAKPFDVDAAIALIINLSGHGRPAPSPDAAWADSAAGPQCELPGLAVPRGLTIWGDARIYRQYLRKFARDYADVDARIGTLDDGALAALAHQLSGEAGSLALVEVAMLSSEVEGTLRGGADAAPSLARLRDALAMAIESIAVYARIDTPVALGEADADAADADALPGPPTS